MTPLVNRIATISSGLIRFCSAGARPKLDPESTKTRQQHDSESSPTRLQVDSKHSPTILSPESTVPDLDWAYLLDARNTDAIEANVRRRKGIGDVWKLLRLAASRGVGGAVPGALDDELIREALRIPNATHPDVPVGDESNARVVSLHNSPPNFKFEAKNHVEIGERLKGLRTAHVGRAASKKGYYLMNDFALLHRALVKHSVDLLRLEGFGLVSVPDVIDSDVVRACGFETHGANHAVFKVDVDGAERCLSGTAEMGVAALLRGRVFEDAELPLKIAAVSRCFRAELGFRAIDRGLYRVPFFDKVEMFVVTRDSTSESDAALDDLLRVQTRLLLPFGFHFRFVEMPTEELGASAFRKFDTEAWIQSRSRFSEIASASNCTDYQARRLGLRRRLADGSQRGCHTLNGTACALPRVMQAIIEHHQTEEGDVEVPSALVPLCRGIRKMGPKPDWPVYYYSGHRNEDGEE